MTYRALRTREIEIHCCQVIIHEYKSERRLSLLFVDQRYNHLGSNH